MYQIYEVTWDERKKVYVAREIYEIIASDFTHTDEVAGVIMHDKYGATFAYEFPPGTKPEQIAQYISRDLHNQPVQFTNV